MASTHNCPTALQRASRLARQRQVTMYVVCEGGKYDVATEEDLDTYYLGATVVAEFLSDGSRVEPDS